MAEGRIRNVFTDGMVQDSLPSLSNGSSYRIARNAVTESDEHMHFGLVNERSTELVASFGGDIVGETYLEERDATLYFVDAAGGSLYLFHHTLEQTEFICSASEFGCDWGFGGCEYLYAESKRHNKCEELYVYFSSQCVYYVVNVDEMLDPVRKASVIECEDCEYFRLFHSICGPKLSAIPVSYSGSSTEGGAVAFAVQLEDDDGNTSNWFQISNTAYMQTEDNIAGQPGTSAVRLTIDNLDPRYDKVNIAVIKTTAGVTTAEVVDGRAYGTNGLTYDYYGQRGEPISIAEITTRVKHYLQGQDLIQQGGRMYFYNLKNEKNLNYQKYANEIVTELVEYEVSMEQNLKYNYVSLLRSEVYVPAIAWNYNDGTRTFGFFIPFNGGSTGTPGNPDGLQAFPRDIEPGEFDSSTNAIGTYQPVRTADFDTTDQFVRRRNPDEEDIIEDAIQDDIENIDTDEDDLVAASDCLNCGPTTTAFTDDLDDLSNIEQNWAEYLAQTSLDHDTDDVTLNETESLKEAAERLYRDGVKEREYITRKKPSLSHVGVSPVPKGDGGGFEEVAAPGEGSSLRGDNWVDADGNNLTEEAPRVTWVGSPQTYESEIDYPDAKDCNGERFYPEGKITFPKIPSAAARPHFVSYQNGVVNKYQPENYEYGNTYVRLLGFRFSNIHIPTDDELPKPLCPTNPFSIVYVKRTDQNKSVFAKGWFSGTFDGEVYGVTHKFPRHGVNSFEHVDRYVHSGPDNTSRLGVQTPDSTTYTFHSPDTDMDKSFLPITHVKPELQMLGSGWRYGLYAEGRKPEVDQWAGTRKDQRGARVANNINHYEPANSTLVEVSGITYAEGDKVVSNPSGIDAPLMNRHRESSVYLQTSRVLPGSTLDRSFVGDVLDHFCPTEANAPYGGLVRDLPDQYGSVEGFRYSPLGLEGTRVHGDFEAGGMAEIEGICGDVFIVPYSKRRTSYVSNKIGDEFSVRRKPNSPCRRRSVCDSPDDKVFELLGINNHPTRLPQSGDQWDARNYAGLHTVNGECGVNGLSRDCAAAAAQGVSESDWYYPQVLNSLVHCVVESHVNAPLRETGVGSQVNTGNVFYPKLKDLYLDSDAPDSHPWEECYLNRFHCEIEQPSLKQLSKKALIRTFLNLIVPMLGLLRFDGLESVVDSTAYFVTLPMLTAMWVYANNTLFTDKKLNELLGIGDCRTDEEGGDLDGCIRQWEDNYNRYNYDYSKMTDEDVVYAPPLNYNTCSCDDCDLGDRYGNGRQVNNEIYYSAQQNLDSEIDAYRNIRVNGYNEMPAHAGNLKRLFIQGQGMYAHTSDGIWVMRLAEGRFPGDIGSQLTGSGEVLAEPIMLFEGSREGFMGTRDPNAAINVGGWGYFFIDGAKIYRFAGSQPEEISAYGMRKFFQRHLPFCVEGDCYDEKVGSNFYSLGWDNRLNRLLVTKRDTSAGSFTMSYTPIGAGSDGRGKWLSFHDYLPDGYSWDRSNLYSYTGGEVWRHNTGDSFQTFYGQYYPFMVETTAVDKEGFKEIRLSGITLVTEARRQIGQTSTWSEELDVTFTQLAVWTNYQTTGLRDVVWIGDNAGTENNARTKIGQDYSVVRAHREKGAWQINEVPDLLDTNCVSPIAILVKDDPCEVIPEVNNAIVSCDKPARQNMKNRNIRGRYVNYRLVYSDSDQVELKLIFVETTDDAQRREKIK